MQQKVHSLVVFLCSLRTAFFVVSVDAWNPDKGIVVSEKVAFYFLDEFSTVAFFSLTSVLALFWAELYYLAIDMPYIFVNIVKPLTYFLNLVAYTVVTVYYCLTYVYYSVDTDYVYLRYSLLIAIIFIFSALMFTYFAYAASHELNKVSMQLTARRSRVRALKILAAICITSLLIRPILLLMMTKQRLQTDTGPEIAMFIAYYLVLELLPILITMNLYRVEITDNTGAPEEEDEDEDDEGGDEHAPMVGSGPHSSEA